MKMPPLGVFNEALKVATATIEAEREMPARPEFAALYHDDLLGFVRDCVQGFELTPYHDEIFGQLPTRKRVAVRGPHGLGKTAGDAVVVWWFALTRDAANEDWKVITTASAWRQLTKYLWPEVHKWGRRLRWDVIGRAPVRAGKELLDMSIKLDHGEAFAVASNDHAKIEGAHADQLLYLFDEAKTIPSRTWDAAEGAFSGDGVDGRQAFALANSTPGDAEGRFHAIHTHVAGLEDWWPRHVTLEEAISARRISPEWARLRLRLWGLESSLYRNRVLGEFSLEGDKAAIIPLVAVERAVERWRAWRDSGGPVPTPTVTLGVDVGTGRPGRDPATIARRYGPLVAEVEVLPPCNEMELAGEVHARLRNGGRAVVDGTWGSGVAARLRELGNEVVIFIAGGASDATDMSGEMKFANRRAEAWWGMRERLMADDSDEMLPDDDTLIGELTTPRRKMASNGRILVESKEDIGKRLRGKEDREDEGGSTNRADAVIQAFSVLAANEGSDEVGFTDDEPAFYERTGRGESFDMAEL